MNKAYLYCITNRRGGKQYIGVSMRPKERFRHHFRGGNNGSLLLCRAGKKYGEENFELEILGVGESKFIFELEKQEIKLRGTKVPNGYNIVDGGKGGQPGNIISDATRQKISKRLTGLKRTAETCAKMAEAKRGFKHSEKTKKQMSQSQKDRLPHPEEVRIKISESLKGRIFSEEHKKKLSSSRLGTHFSAEHCENIRQAKMGTKASAETKRKMSQGRQREKSPSAKKVLVNYIEYNCMADAADAADAIGMNLKPFRARFAKYKKNNNFPDGWAYL